MTHEIHIGRAIRKLRKAKNIQQKFFTQTLKLNPCAMYYTESRANVNVPGRLEAICEVLGVTVPALMIYAVDLKDVPEHCREHLGFLQKLIEKK